MVEERPTPPVRPGRCGRRPREGGAGGPAAGEGPGAGGRRAGRGAGWLLAGVGTHLAAATVTGFLLGYFLDGWLGTRPWLMLLLGGLGFLGGVLRAHRLLSRWMG